MMRIANTRLQPVLTLLVSCLISSQVFAAGEVRQVGTSNVPATPFRYTADGSTHTWGAGENELIEFFSTDQNTYRFASVANRVELVRDDIVGVSTGVPCGVFAERAGVDASLLAADFPNDAEGSGNCDIAAMLASRVVNRGALDLFSNDGPTPKNVERIDYVYDAGLFAPLSAEALSFGGHLVAEKRGNNRIQVAAILSLDAFGQPMEFGPLVRVNEFFSPDASQVRYGETNLRHNYSFFQSNSVTPQSFPVYLQDSTETVAMAFVSASVLGLRVGQVYHGFSYFGDDVDSSIHILTDVSTFPNNTSDSNIVPGDGADIYGGVSGFFTSDSISVSTGAVFLDENDNGLQDNNEAGISGVTVTLVEDVNQNGIVDDGDIQLGQIDSGTNGEIILPGLPNGSFILVVDPNDANFPGGTAVPADASMLPFVVNNDDPENLDFAVSDNILNDDGGAAQDGDGDGDGNGNGQDDQNNGETVGGPDTPNDASPIDATNPEDNIPVSTTSAVADTAEVIQGGSVTIDVLANDVDGPGAGLTIVSVDGADNGTVMIVDGQIVFTPDAGFVGTEELTVVIVDADGVESTSAITVEVVADNTPAPAPAPAPATNAVADTAEVTQGGSVTIDVLANDIDGPGAGLTIVSVEGADNGTVMIVDGQIVFTPDAGFVGTETLTVVIVDADGVESSSTVTVEVIADNTPVITTDAVADTVAVNQGESVVIDVLANDIDGAGAGLTIVSVEGTGNGTAMIVNGQIVFTPDAGFIGTEMLTYVIVDADGNEASGTITVEVIANNVPVVATDAVPDTAEVNQGDSVTIDALANDIDGAGSGLTIVSVEGTGNGTLTIVDGMIVYTPNFGFFGTDNLVYTIVDADGVESSSTISVQVIRFSDINNNGLNDFDECDCTSLQLETGVHGSGIGGAVHWSLLMLLALIGLVRTQAHSFRQRIFWSA